MSGSLFTGAVDQLDAGGEGMLAIRAITAARDLVAQAEGHERGSDPTATLIPFDASLDVLLATASVLTVFARPEARRRGVPVALRLMAEASRDEHGRPDPIVEALLGRTVCCLTAVALALDRTDALTVLGSVCLTEPRRQRESVLATTALRHLDLYEGNAGEAFQAHADWLISRPWRASIPTLSTETNVLVALAEADIISGCLIMAASVPSGTELFSAGVGRAGRAAEIRLTSRLSDPLQRGHLREFFAVDDDALEPTLEAAYGHLRDGQSWPSRRSGLFDNE